MNNFNLNIQEDAKSDWMNIVKKHKRKQKGLPALSKLNTDAGNVEYNVTMFNKMNTPTEGPSNNPISGPHGENVSAPTGMGESLNEVYTDMNDETIDLEYENLPIEVVTRQGSASGVYDYNYGNWVPDDNETSDLLVDWTYEVKKPDVVECLVELPEVQQEYWTDDISAEIFEQRVVEDFDLLLDRYLKQVKEFFYERAVDDAQDNYEVAEDDHDYEPYDESVSKFTDNKLDDVFDMSLRSLL